MRRGISADWPVHSYYGVSLAIAGGMLLTSCYFDALTAPPADESTIEFAVTGDSVVVLGDSLRLSAVFGAGDGTGATRITWISSDTTVARVDDASGMVTGTGAGIATIRAFLVAPDLDNDLLRTWPIEVVYAGIGMVNDSLTGFGETRTLEVRGLDVQGNAHEVVPGFFTTPDDTIISLDSSGTAVALQSGTATVNATWDVFSTQAPILVRQVAGRITLGVSQVQFPVLQVDTTVTVEVRDTQDSIIVAPQLTWVTSDPSAVSVTSAGVMRALQRASALITVTTDTVSAQLPVAVVQEVANLALNAGNNQSAAAGTTLPTAVAVLAQDGGGNPIGGALVTFSVAAGGGQLTDSVQLTDAAGIASFGGWQLGTTVGANTLTATADTLSVQFQATGIPGAASGATSLITVSAGTVDAGTASALTLQTRDQFGNDLTTGGLIVVFSHSGGASTGTIGATTDNGDGSYTASFSGEIAGTATTISATVTGVTVTNSAPTITVLPGAPSLMGVSAGDNQTAMVGAAVFVAPAVSVVDAYDNPVPGVEVTFGVTSGGGGLTGAVDTTDAGGVATVGGWTLGGTPGTNTLSGTAGPLSAGFTATGTTAAASATMSLVTVSVGTLPSGSVSVLRLQSKDAGGNDLTIGGYTVLFTATGGVSTGTISSTTDSSNGVYTATFTGAIAGTATTIGATINGSAVTSTLPTITVTPGPVSPATSVVTVSADTVTAGSSVTLTVDTKDAYGNDVPVGGEVVTFGVSGGTSTGSIGATTDVGDGTYTASFTGQVVGTPTTVDAQIGGQAITTPLPTVGVVGGVAGCIAPPSGLVNWWTGDGDAVDIVGGTTGTLVGGATFAPGVADQAFSFDGVDDMVAAGIHPALAQLTIDAWVFSNGFSNWNDIITLDTSSSSRNIVVHPSQRFQVWSTSLFSTTVLLPGQWYHVAWTHDGTTGRLYVDGVEEASLGFALDGAASAEVFIGGWPGLSEYWSGLIDEVTVFDRALTGQEIQGIYNSGTSGKCKG